MYFVQNYIKTKIESSEKTKTVYIKELKLNLIWEYMRSRWRHQERLEVTRRRRHPRESSNVLVSSAVLPGHQPACQTSVLRRQQPTTRSRRSAPWCRGPPDRPPGDSLWWTLSDVRAQSLTPCPCSPAVDFSSTTASTDVTGQRLVMASISGFIIHTANTSLSLLCRPRDRWQWCGPRDIRSWSRDALRTKNSLVFKKPSNG